MVSPIRKYPEKPGEFSSLSITEFNNALQTVTVSKDEMYDLRFARTEDLLSKVRTILLRPDRGVSMEFNLTDKKEVWDRLLEIYDKYSEMIPSVKYLMQFSSIPGSGTVDSRNTVRQDNTWVIEYLTAAASRFTGLGLGASDAIRNAVNDFITEVDKAITEVRKHPKTLDPVYTITSLASVFDRESSNSTSSFRNIATVKQNIRKLASAPDEDLETETVYLIRTFIEGLNSFTRDMKEEDPAENTSPRLAVIRLFPSAAAVIPQLPQIATIRQSYRKYIQTAVPAPNITAQLRNIIAFNTLDTQWVTFYMEVFAVLFRYRNPKFVLRCGTYRIQDCNIAESIAIPDTGSSLESFNMDIISERTGLDLESL